MAEMSYRDVLVRVPGGRHVCSGQEVHCRPVFLPLLLALLLISLSFHFARTLVSMPDLFTSGCTCLMFR